MQPPEGPPICTALMARPVDEPPATSSTISRMVMPMGTSASPPRLIFPASANTLVPRLFSVPTDANAAPPLSRIHGTLAYVSTLLMLVGSPQSPFCAGNGGRGRGMPRLPSMEARSAVSSPHTKAPAPSLTLMSKENPLPRMFSPKNPAARACAMAMFKRLTASGYSARQ